MIRVTAPSRLHFGLFRLPSEQRESLLAVGGKDTERHFGGVGLMIDKPGLEVSLSRAKDWSASGPLAERALAFAQDFLKNSPELDFQRFALSIKHSAPAHVGLGSGTQLGLAVARALALALGRLDWDAGFLARRIGRGQRSGIGIHGFQHGGFLVDGGKKAGANFAPLIARHDFPPDWAILLILPRDFQGVHGHQEREIFAQLAKDAAAQPTDALCRLVLMGMLPALVEHDLLAFGEALYDFNRRVGEMFKPCQGGTYANPRTAAIVEFFRKNGVQGVGQSSWGPAVFAVHEAQRVSHLADLFRTQSAFSRDEAIVCRADNSGAHVVE